MRCGNVLRDVLTARWSSGRLNSRRCEVAPTRLLSNSILELGGCCAGIPLEVQAQVGTSHEDLGLKKTADDGEIADMEIVRKINRDRRRSIE